MSEQTGRSARDRAVDALARREHSRRELEQKLAQKGVEQAQIAPALDELAAGGLQDDRRFAAAYARQRAARGYGPRRIIAELKQRGIDGPLIAQILAASECDWPALAAAARRKKFRAQAGSVAERARQTRFLEYRGFEPEQIRYALGSAVDDEDF